MTTSSHHLSVRSRVANAAGAAARFASRALGRGSGGMIGGEVALRISPKFLAELAAPFSSVIVTGTTATTPKSHPLSNTICPSSQLFPST